MIDSVGEFALDAINVLLFSVGGFRFGVESMQIIAIDSARGDNETRIVNLDSLLGLTNASRDDDTVFLEFHQAGGESCLFLVDIVEDIIEVSLSEVKLLPKIIADRLSSKGVWGAVQRGENIVILLDFNCLLKNMDSKRKQ